MKLSILLIALLFSFCLWLMFESFSYQDHTFYIADYVIYDFAIHIPLIRSFSFGANSPPEYPLFPGEPIRYHFLFYFLVGMLERIGLRIDWALNIPSAMGLFGLSVTLYFLTKRLFQRRLVALLAVIFLLLNGSLTFVKFFQNHLISLLTPWEIVTNNKFYSFGPYDGGEIGAFWNLTVFINQRHFAWGLSLGLLFILTTFNLMKTTPKIKIGWGILWGIVLGILPFFHQPILLILALIMILYFFLYSLLRLFLITSGSISALIILPQIYIFSQGSNMIEWYPGFLIHDTLNPWHFLTYWFKNLGLHLFLIPLGLYLAPKEVKKLFLLPILVIFLIPNLLRFSPEVATNHKFFNFALILGSIFSAYSLVRLLDHAKKMHSKLIRLVIRIAFIMILLSLILSGVIDFFPLINASKHTFTDAPKNELVDWFLKQTEPDAVILNSSAVYHPASLAGRKIFLGWPMFAWSLGLDVDQRLADFKTIWETDDLSLLCRQIKKHNLSYAMYEKSDMPGIQPQVALFDKFFPLLYENIKEDIKIYDLRNRCIKND